jgi:RimJ/RimL family protein N-acetyltransferase
MTVTIERIRPEHIEGFHRAVDLVARERKYLAFLEGPPLEMSRAFVLNNISKGNPQYGVLSDAAVVGWCDIVRSSRPVYAHGGTLGMGVLPAFRGQGIGRRLIEATLMDARRIGLARVELTVHASNAPAITLYERVGFKHEGVKRDAVLIDGQFKDVSLMALVFRRADAGQPTIEL